MATVAMADWSFWSLRKAAWRSDRWRTFVTWDLARAGLCALGVVLGVLWSSTLLHEEHIGPATRFAIAATTFGTFLASFVLSIMTATGKRELDLVDSTDQARRLAERLTWLLSDQLLMVFCALMLAVSGLSWLALVAIGHTTGWLAVGLTGALFGLTLLTAVNAVRLPLFAWELQVSALEEERRRAVKRIRKEIEEQGD